MRNPSRKTAMFLSVFTLLALLPLAASEVTGPPPSTKPVYLYKITFVRAARKAGFNSPDEIGPYMRTLIDMHRDTMGVAIK